MPARSSAMIAESTGLGSLAEAIHRRLYGPRIEALLGIRPLVPGRDVLPPPGEPCAHCGAIRDEHGRVLWARTVIPSEGRRSLRPTGIQEGDSLACVCCQCLSPADERGRGRRGDPIRVRDTPERPRTELTAKQRRVVARQAAGRVWLAMREAEAAGDRERAAELQTLIYRHRDGEIDDAELDRLGGTTPDACRPSPVRTAAGS